MLQNFQALRAGIHKISSSLGSIRENCSLSKRSNVLCEFQRGRALQRVLSVNLVRALPISSTCRPPVRFQSTLVGLQEKVTTVYPSSGKKLSAVSLDAKNRMVEVIWADGERDRYPSVWLRDNCQCSRCFLQTSQSRQFLMRDLDCKTHPSSVEIFDTGSLLGVNWPDGHRSSYKASWLVQRAFNPAAQEKRHRTYRGPVTLWGADDLKRSYRIPKVDFSHLMNSDAVMLNWLEELDRFGLTLVTNVPPAEGQVNLLGSRIAFLKPSHYGIGEDTVMSTIEPNNLSDSTLELGLHTDLVYYDYMPGVQFLHCIQQSDRGGENNLVDGFFVARQLRRLHPRAFHLLTTVTVDFHDVGLDIIPFYKIHRAPIIQLNKEGAPERINFNNQVRDSFFNVSLELVQPMYEAMKLYHDLCNDPKNKARLKLASGEMLAFDNMRVLHGREAFQDEHTGRHLETGYMDWDEVRSKLRVLRCKLEGTEDLPFLF